MTKIQGVTPDSLGMGGRGYPFKKKERGGNFFRGLLIGSLGGRWTVKGGPPFVCVNGEITYADFKIWRVLPASGPLAGHGGADYLHAFF